MIIKWYLTRCINPENGETIHINILNSKESAILYVNEWSEKDNIEYDYYIKEVEVYDT